MPKTQKSLDFCAQRALLFRFCDPVVASLLHRKLPWIETGWRIKILSDKELLKVLSKIGFQHIRTSRNHAILNKIDDEKGKIIIPVHYIKSWQKGPYEA